MAAPKGGRKAHQDSVLLPAPQLVEALRDLLCARLVAYIGSVKQARAVRQRAEDQRKSSGDALLRLRTACQIAALLSESDSPAVVQARFQAMNLHLDDLSPARVL
jgi:hypothetical protein